VDKFNELEAITKNIDSEGCLYYTYCFQLPLTTAAWVWRVRTLGPDFFRRSQLSVSHESTTAGSTFA